MARSSSACLPPAAPLVTPGTALGLPQLIHLGHPLLELVVLAFLVAVPLLLQWTVSRVRAQISCPHCSSESRPRPPRRIAIQLGRATQEGRGGELRVSTYLTLPGQVVRVGPAPVEGDQEVGAVVPVCHGELRIAHLLAGRLCWGGREKGQTSAGVHW